MSTIVCPISSESYDKNAGRIGAVLTALLLISYGLLSFWPIIVFVLIDYTVRVATNRVAPTAWSAKQIASVLRVQPQRANKGPKIFAWRLGFLMALLAVVLAPISTGASIVVAFTLAALNLVDGVLNFCVGCYLYTYLVLPRFGPAT